MKDWFAQQRERERRNYYRLLAGIIGLVLACTAIASLIMAGGQ